MFRTTYRDITLSILGSSFFLACSVEPGPSRTTGPSLGTDEPPPTRAQAPIAWETCAVPDLAGTFVLAADCARVDMPLRREQPAAGIVPIAMYRIRAPRQPATAQMWMLNGGPGGAGFSLAAYQEVIAREVSDSVDVYLVDHRGTGESDFLSCPAADLASTASDYVKRCSDQLRRKWGDKLDGYTTTESAYDVRDLIDRAATTTQKVYVYGGSYGSYWTHRLLQLPNVHIDGAITDGNCISASCNFDGPQTLAVDEVMNRVFDACKVDAKCASKVGPDPRSFAAGVLTKLAAGHCSNARFAKGAPADIPFEVSDLWMAGIMPVLFRLDRCGAQDVEALDSLHEKATAGFGAGPTPLPTFYPTPQPRASRSLSSALQNHVILSEMVSLPPHSRTELEMRASTLLFGVNKETLDLSYVDLWQKYPRDAYVGAYSRRNVPWLMLQGTFDFKTPLSQVTDSLAKLSNPSLHYVEVEGAGHGVAFSSPCARSIVKAFVSDPQASPDTSCLADLKAHPVAVDPRAPPFFFGTVDAWD